MAFFPLEVFRSLPSPAILPARKPQAGSLPVQVVPRLTFHSLQALFQPAAPRSRTVLPPEPQLRAASVPPVRKGKPHSHSPLPRLGRIQRGSVLPARERPSLSWRFQQEPAHPRTRRPRSPNPWRLRPQEPRRESDPRRFRSRSFPSVRQLSRPQAAGPRVREPFP